MIPGVISQEPRFHHPIGSTYVASAVHISNSHPHLSIASLSCGTDTGFYSFSFWATNLFFGNQGTDLFANDATGNYTPFQEILFGDQFLMNFGSVPAGHTFNRQWKNNVPIAAFDQDVWVHYLFSADTNQASGFKIATLYVSTSGTVNDTAITPDSTNLGGTAFIVPLNGKQFIFGDDTLGQGPTCDVADVWFGPNIKLHDGTGAIPTVTRRQFISAAGKPVDPTTWPTSAVQLYGDATHFPTNHGTGGAFTLTGSLTNASTHP